ncbi:hypothetical protein Pint_00512 [Pistacia integerrima]|uniref:Uncharacterized protein n=1 Tax=Pistacia integerrima TaxID=434235 RepID=A0ACC0ZLA9_9ROSI|nr:hypothetical protein Pint_00512 [Pistacia integerrima]
MVKTPVLKFLRHSRLIDAPSHFLRYSRRNRRLLKFPCNNPTQNQPHHLSFAAANTIHQSPQNPFANNSLRDACAHGEGRCASSTRISHSRPPAPPVNLTAQPPSNTSRAPSRDRFVGILKCIRVVD